MSSSRPIALKGQGITFRSLLPPLFHAPGHYYLPTRPLLILLGHGHLVWAIATPSLPPLLAEGLGCHHHYSSKLGSHFWPLTTTIDVPLGWCLHPCPLFKGIIAPSIIAIAPIHEGCQPTSNYCQPSFDSHRSY